MAVVLSWERERHLKIRTKRFSRLYAHGYTYSFLFRSGDDLEAPWLGMLSLSEKWHEHKKHRLKKNWARHTYDKQDIDQQNIQKLWIIDASTHIQC